MDYTRFHYCRIGDYSGAVLELEDNRPYTPIDYQERCDTWSYDGVIVEFERTEDHAPESPGTVSSVFIDGGSYESMLGVKVGTLESEVREIYKDHISEYYVIDRISLDFHINDGVVVGIALYRGGS
jgi:hypothetical protein